MIAAERPGTLRLASSPPRSVLHAGTDAPPPLPGAPPPVPAPVVVAVMEVLADEAPPEPVPGAALKSSAPLVHPSATRASGTATVLANHVGDCMRLLSGA